MIKSVTVTNHLGESLKLELAFPEKSGFAVQSIEGLGPPKANINTSDLATDDGSMYNSARVGSRNIVFNLGFMFSTNIELTRQKSYKYFPIKKHIRIIVETDSRIVETYGYVESNEPTIFHNNTRCIISVICPDPYLYSIRNSVTVFSGIADLFEFPFSNESLDENLIEFGVIINKTEETVFYSGDADVGVYMLLHVIGTATNVAIYNNQTRETMKIDTDRLEEFTGSGLIAGDDIIITTMKGNKRITLLREGEYINILNCLDRDTDWFRLVKGDNLFSYTAESGVTNLQFKVENRIAYEGV